MNLQKFAVLGTALTLLLNLTACQSAGAPSQTSSAQEQALVLSDEGITLDGQTLTENSESSVTVSHDIVYYQSGMGSNYGDGSEEDTNSEAEAQAHTVVTIRQPGTYRVSGVLSAGQLAIDLGEDARTDPDAVVTLILDGVNITCTVALPFSFTMSTNAIPSGSPVRKTVRRMNIMRPLRWIHLPPVPISFWPTTARTPFKVPMWPGSTRRTPRKRYMSTTGHSTPECL